MGRSGRAGLKSCWKLAQRAELRKAAKIRLVEKRLVTMSSFEKDKFQEGREKRRRGRDRSKVKQLSGGEPQLLISEAHGRE